MAYILVRQKVEDYTKWKEAFDGDANVRAPGGSRGGFVFQNASDPNEVLVLLEWNTLESLQQFAQSDGLRERMQRAGVVGSPEIHFLHLVDRPPV